MFCPQAGESWRLTIAAKTCALHLLSLEIAEDMTNQYRYLPRLLEPREVVAVIVLRIRYLDNLRGELAFLDHSMLFMDLRFKEAPYTKQIVIEQRKYLSRSQFTGAVINSWASRTRRILQFVVSAPIGL